MNPPRIALPSFPPAIWQGTRQRPRPVPRVLPGDLARGR